MIKIKFSWQEVGENIHDRKNWEHWVYVVVAIGLIGSEVNFDAKNRVGDGIRWGNKKFDGD